MSARDFFGTYSPSYEASGREEFAEARARLSRRNLLKFVETPLPHGLSYSLRVDVYNWFERHLKHSERVIDEEPPTAPEPAETLWCGPTGNTVRDFGGKTPFALLSERARSIRTPDARARFARPAPDGPARRRAEAGSARRDEVSRLRHPGGRGQHRPEGLGARVAVPAEARRGRGCS